MKKKKIIDWILKHSIRVMNAFAQRGCMYFNASLSIHSGCFHMLLLTMFNLTLCKRVSEEYLSNKELS